MATLRAMGRPPKDPSAPLEHVVRLRIDAKRLAKLDRLGVERSETVRALIDAAPEPKRAKRTLKGKDSK